MPRKPWGKVTMAAKMTPKINNFNRSIRSEAFLQSLVPAHERVPLPQPAVTSKHALASSPRQEFYASAGPSSLASMVARAPAPAEAAVPFVTSLLAIPSHLPSLSEDLAAQMVTHPSFSPATQGFAPHNLKLAFLGRRLLEMHLQLFLLDASAKEGGSSSWSAPAGEDGHLSEDSPRALARHVFEPTRFGSLVGGAWRVEKAMRVTKGQASTDVLRASVVESIVGGISHAYGAPVTFRLFHTSVLPYLAPALPSWLRPHIDAARLAVDEQHGGLWGPKTLEGVAAPASASSEGRVTVEA